MIGEVRVSSLDQNANRIVMADGNGELYASSSLAGSGLGDNLGNHLATAGIGRSNHNVGHLVGSYNNVGANSNRTNPIYTIGSNYNPAVSSLSNMYGIGYAHGNLWGSSSARPTGWGQYVAADGDIRVILEASSGRIWASGDVRAPLFYDINNTGYYLDPASTSRLSVNITNENYTYGWFRNYSQMEGFYNQQSQSHFYSQDYNYWVMDANRGLIFRDGYNSTIQGYTYYDDSGNFGLLSPSGSWRYRVDNTNTEAYGNGFYAPTTYTSLIYDRGNTGYYLNLDGYSQTHAVYANNWFRPQGSSGLYFQSYGGGWHMTDATWIRQYNGKRVYLSNGLNVAGGIDPQYGASPRINSNHDNGTGGGLRVADDGGFYDFNNGWIEYRGSTGMLWRSNNSGWVSMWTMYNSSGGGGISDKRVATQTNGWGLLGASGNAWWRSYAYGFVNTSTRESKRDIRPVEDNLLAFIGDELDNITPYFYKYKLETDELQEGNEPKYRPNMHMGLLVDNAPDYLLDNTFSGVDIYAAATMGIAGAKHNREEIKQLKEAVGLNEETKAIQDFGSLRITSSETWVSFNSKFSNQLDKNTIPVVTVTSNKPGVLVSVIDKNSEGFKVHSSDASIIIDYIAMANVVNQHKPEPSRSLTPAQIKDLEVDESVKQRMRDYVKQTKADLEEMERQKGIEAIAIQDSIRKAMALPEDFVGPEENENEQQKEIEEIRRQAEEAKKNFIEVEENQPMKNGDIETTPVPLGEGVKSGDAEHPFEDNTIETEKISNHKLDSNAPKTNTSNRIMDKGTTDK